MHVSIIIPSHNRGEWLLESVDSGLAQTHRDVDVVVVDDGSTDPRTLDVLNDLQRRDRVTVIRQPQSGQSAAMNAGIRHTDAEVVLPLGDDDKIAPTYVARAVALMSEDPSIGVVDCLTRRFGAINDRWILPEHSPEQLAISNCVVACAHFRRADWEKLGGFNEKLPSHEDWDFWIRLTQLGRRFVRIPEELFFYRKGHLSLSVTHAGSVDRKLEAYTRVFDANEDFFRQHARLYFREHIRLTAELAQWRGTYGSAERVAGPAIRSLLERVRTLRRRLRRSAG